MAGSFEESRHLGNSNENGGVFGSSGTKFEEQKKVFSSAKNSSKSKHFSPIFVFSFQGENEAKIDMITHVRTYDSIHVNLVGLFRYRRMLQIQISWFPLVVPKH